MHILQLLENSNVETFILFRSVTPLAVCILDVMCRPKSSRLPSARTAATLFVIFVSACLYAWQDMEWSTKAYSWGCVYVTIISIEIVRNLKYRHVVIIVIDVLTPQVYVKDVISNIECDNWTLVWYNNWLSWLLSLAVLAFPSQQPFFRDYKTAGSAVAASCLFGVFCCLLPL